MKYKLLAAFGVAVLASVPFVIRKVRRDKRDTERANAAEEQVHNAFVQENNDSTEE
jgi:hypothetical protein